MCAFACMSVLRCNTQLADPPSSRWRKHRRGEPFRDMLGSRGAATAMEKENRVPKQQESLGSSQCGSLAVLLLEKKLQTKTQVVHDAAQESVCYLVETEGSWGSKLANTPSHL